jgi:hypothetical protein
MDEFEPYEIELKESDALQQRRSAILPQSPYDPYAVEIKQEYPPNIGKIRQAGIPLGGKEIFAYDNVIYNPSGGRLTEPLIAHEKVHFKQQGDDTDAWWERYLVDMDFRLEQELAAHRAEYKDFCRSVRQREKRVRFLSEIALRLSGPLYGGKITHRDAMKAIR